MQATIEKLNSGVKKLKDIVAKYEKFLKIQGITEAFEDFIRPKGLREKLQENVSKMKSMEQKEVSENIQKRKRDIAI